jgi:integrase
MPKLTKRTVDDAQPSAARYLIWDSAATGFALQVMPSGVKSFVVQYRNADGRSRRMTIGRYGTLTVDQARTHALEVLAKSRAGSDPVEDRRTRRSAATLSDLFDLYLKERGAIRQRHVTRTDIASMINLHLRPRLGKIKVQDINASDVQGMHDAMAHIPRRANYALGVLRKCIDLAEQWGIRSERRNPCSQIRRYPENHRTRFLSTAELETLGKVLAEAESVGLPWRAVTGGRNPKHLAKPENQRSLISWQACAAIRLLLLTAARLTEVLALKWSDVDFTAGTVAMPDVKGGARVPYPAGAATLDLLRSIKAASRTRQGAKPGPASPYVLPSATDPEKHYSSAVIERAWQRVRWRCGFEDVRLHDLRHTAATHAIRTGASPFTVRDLLRHRNIVTTNRYVSVDTGPLRELANLTGNMMSASLSAPPIADVVKLEARRKPKRD